jgi:hypothetical protein
MQSIAAFRIIGRVGKITEHDKVTKVASPPTTTARRMASE